MFTSGGLSGGTSTIGNSHLSGFQYDSSANLASTQQQGGDSRRESLTPNSSKPTQSLVPVTIKQIFHFHSLPEVQIALAANAAEETKLKINGATVGLVLCVAQLISVSKKGVSYEGIIDDSTCCVPFTYFFSQECDPFTNSKIVVGDYVRVVGDVRFGAKAADGKVSISVRTLALVTHADEVAAHLAEATRNLVRYKLQEKRAMKGTSQSSVSDMGVTNKMSQEPLSENVAPKVASTTTNTGSVDLTASMSPPSSVSTAPGTSVAPDTFETPLEKALANFFTTIVQRDFQGGATVNEIAKHMKTFGNFSQQEIKDLCERWVDEAYLFVPSDHPEVKYLWL